MSIEGLISWEFSYVKFNWIVLTSLSSVCEPRNRSRRLLMRRGATYDVVHLAPSEHIGGKTFMNVDHTDLFVYRVLVFEIHNGGRIF
jgi:hypothetical protein